MPKIKKLTKSGIVKRRPSRRKSPKTRKGGVSAASQPRRATIFVRKPNGT